MSLEKLQVKIPSLKSFEYIRRDRFLLPYNLEKRIGTEFYESTYLNLILQIQMMQDNISNNIFVPSSRDVHDIFNIINPDLFTTGTGTVILRPDENGYSDKSFADLDGKPLELKYTSIAEHGKDWIATSDKKCKILDPSKLVEYPEIEHVKRGMYMVGGYDDDRGVVTRFYSLDKPVSEFGGVPVSVNPENLVVPIGRGSWNRNKKGSMYFLEMDRQVSYEKWRLSIGYESKND